MNEPHIKTSIPTASITGRRIRYTSPDESIRDVDAMLTAWPKDDGTISVEVSEPFDPLQTRLQQYTSYGHLTQQEFDRLFPPTSAQTQ